MVPILNQIIQSILSKPIAVYEQSSNGSYSEPNNPVLSLPTYQSSNSPAMVPILNQIIQSILSKPIAVYKQSSNGSYSEPHNPVLSLPTYHCLQTAQQWFLFWTRKSSPLSANLSLSSNSPAMVPILNQIILSTLSQPTTVFKQTSNGSYSEPHNPVHSLPTYPSKVHFMNFLPSTQTCS